MTEKLLLTVEEAAERLSIGRTKAFELIASGELESVVIGRARRVPVQALEPFIAALRAKCQARHPSGTMQSGWSRTAPGGPMRRGRDAYADGDRHFVDEDPMTSTRCNRLPEAVPLEPAGS
jgi:excisionase family DNA binding protein